MKLVRQTMHVMIACVCLASLAPDLLAQSTPHANPVPPLMERMVGTWDVEQRMWPASGASAVTLPLAVAHRRLIGNAFLEETMDLAPGSKGDPFTRVAYFNYNPVNQQYEYFSIDTRAPQMMNEKTNEARTNNEKSGLSGISLYGGTFVAPRWGEAKNVAFRYRLAISDVQKNRQVVQLYLTTMSEEGGDEFLAFEYVYTRQPESDR